MARTAAKKVGTVKSSTTVRIEADRLRTRNMREREIKMLERAWLTVPADAATAGLGWPTETLARKSMAQIRAAVFAVIPGKQTNKNARDLVHAGVIAGSRAIRRGE